MEILRIRIFKIGWKYQEYLKFGGNTNIWMSSIKCPRPGQIVDGATVERSTSNSVLLKWTKTNWNSNNIQIWIKSKYIFIRLGPNQFGLVNIRQLSEGKEVVKNVKKKFPVGLKANARFCSSSCFLLVNFFHQGYSPRLLLWSRCLQPSEVSTFRYKYKFSDLQIKNFWPTNTTQESIG